MEKLRKDLAGMRVNTEDGDGVIKYVHYYDRSVSIRLDSGGYKRYSVDNVYEAGTQQAVEPTVRVVCPICTHGYVAAQAVANARAERQAVLDAVDYSKIKPRTELTYLEYKQLVSRTGSQVHWRNYCKDAGFTPSAEINSLAL